MVLIFLIFINFAGTERKSFRNTRDSKGTHSCYVTNKYTCMTNHNSFLLFDDKGLK